MVVINDTVTDFKTSVKQIVGRGVRLNKEKREFDDVTDNPLLTHAEKLHIVCDEGKAFQEVIEEIQKEFGLNDKLFSSERGENITVENNPKSDRLKGIFLPRIKVDFKRKEGISILDLIKDADTIISEYQHYNCFSLENDAGALDEKPVSEMRKQASRAGKQALKCAKCYAADKTQVFRNVGIYHWLTGRQKKAIVWWKKSIASGKSLNALPELGRTCFEIGRRIGSDGARFREIDGKNAEAYLSQARQIFQDLRLDWDISRLNGMAAT